METVRPVGTPYPPIRSRGEKINFQHKMCKTAVRLGFLWEAYKPEYWYWELVETARRIILTAVLSVCNTGSSEQNVLSILLAFIFIKIYGYFQPYAEYSDSQMAEVGQSQIFLTYFVIIIIKQGLMNKDWDSLLEKLLIVVNLAIILLGFYYEILRNAEENPDVVKIVTDATRKVAETFYKPVPDDISDVEVDDQEFLEKEESVHEEPAAESIELGTIYNDKDTDLSV